MITGLFTGLFLIMLVYLTVKVILNRRRADTALGEGKDILLKQIIRAHANFCEYVPMFLISMGVLELMNSIDRKILWAIGIIFLIGRCLHAYGMAQAETYTKDGSLESGVKFRIFGMLLTLLCLSVMAAILIGLFFYYKF